MVTLKCPGCLTTCGTRHDDGDGVMISSVFLDEKTGLFFCSEFCQMVDEIDNNPDRHRAMQILAAYSDLLVEQGGRR